MKDLKQETVSKSNHLWRRNRAEATFSGVSVVIIIFQSFSPARWDPYCIPKGWELGKSGTGTGTIWGGNIFPFCRLRMAGWQGQVTTPGERFWRRCTDAERCTGSNTLGRSDRGRLCFLVCSFFPSFSPLSDILPIALQAVSPFQGRFTSSPGELTPKVQTLPWVISVMKSPLATGIVINRTATLRERTRLSFHAPVWRLSLPTPSAYMQGLALLFLHSLALREELK